VSHGLLANQGVNKWERGENPVQVREKTVPRAGSVNPEKIASKLLKRTSLFAPSPQAERGMGGEAGSANPHP
jgi:hypothetical protein